MKQNTKDWILPVVYGEKASMSRPAMYRCLISPFIVFFRSIRRFSRNRSLEALAVMA